MGEGYDYKYISVVMKMNRVKRVIKYFKNRMQDIKLSPDDLKIKTRFFLA